MIKSRHPLLPFSWIAKHCCEMSYKITSFWGKKIHPKTCNFRHLLQKCVNGLKWDLTNENLLFFTLYCLFQHLYRILHSKCINFYSECLNLHCQWMKLRRKYVNYSGSSYNFTLSSENITAPGKYFRDCLSWQISTLPTSTQFTFQNSFFFVRFQLTPHLCLPWYSGEKPNH